ncbi:heavy metal-binding domain-containing protein [Dyadobacter psychrophilus]|uniref:Cu2+-exporting ATPase n=1 Tax=Dyadobacter psychrophilus TaxID=651661 RepID=A0A1T5FSJ7_9BACT|nr:heavy metal-binding domain-containing protein [Dyadobacter psychrophilus]SKB99097.1 Cu2+-exporting ATPase [Dyadobacter psychrophilus]
MKNVLFAVVMLLFTACGGNNHKTEKSANETTAAAGKKYACPMQCEGEKTYAEAGKCPVCKMDLQEVAMGETDSTGHNH